MTTGDRQALRPNPPGRRPIRRAIVGRPMATGEMEETLLPKFLALPIFASDPLSSVAYATEAGMVVLLDERPALRAEIRAIWHVGGKLQPWQLKRTKRRSTANLGKS